MKKFICGFVFVSFLLFSSNFASADVLYDNGPVDGTIGAWNINSLYSIADSFTLSSPSTVTGVKFFTWVFHGDTPSTVNWAITTQPFGGISEASGYANLTYSFLFTDTNGNGFDIGKATFSIPALTLLSNTTYWLELSDSKTLNGGYFAWDINSGPSVAYNNNLVNVANYPPPPGFIPGSNSDPFQILGTNNSNPVPEPVAWLLFCTGITGLVTARRKKNV